MIYRAILEEARYSLKQFRALCITGPRQSGKTTLSKILLKGKPYVNFEDPTTEAEFLTDPKKFLEKFPNGGVLDEVQRVPEIFRHLQILLDKRSSRGQFVLTGSNNFLLYQQISQSLAGRAGYLTLLPLSYAELKLAKAPVNDILVNILSGGYPEIVSRKLNPQKWMQSYIQTYVQRDVRQLKNITNLTAFNKLIQLCASHAGQILNRDELAKQIGIDSKTVQSWIGLLEASYIVFLLHPWHNNLNKRIIKSPKIYFYDTGLLCALLQINSKDGLRRHAMMGAIFENWCIAEIKKNRANQGLNDGLYFFRDHLGNEVDLIVDKEFGPQAIEIKSSGKKDRKLLSGLKYWSKYQSSSNGLLLYQGQDSETDNPLLNYLSWKNIDQL
ncbi:MAG: ATP-binding protein [Bacteroidota bacterium]|nr:ATP-binding protein [Bacteroidota bacterium]